MSSYRSRQYGGKSGRGEKGYKMKKVGLFPLEMCPTREVSSLPPISLLSVLCGEKGRGYQDQITGLDKPPSVESDLGEKD